MYDSGCSTRLSGTRWSPKTRKQKGERKNTKSWDQQSKDQHSAAALWKIVLNNRLQSDGEMKRDTVKVNHRILLLCENQPGFSPWTCVSGGHNWKVGWSKGLYTGWVTNKRVVRMQMYWSKLLTPAANLQQKHGNMNFRKFWQLTPKREKWSHMLQIQYENTAELVSFEHKILSKNTSSSFTGINSRRV